MRLYWIVLLVLAVDVALHFLALLAVLVQRPGPGEPDGSMA